MSAKKGSTSFSAEDSPPASQVEIPVSTIVLKDERSWKSFLGPSDSGSSSILQMNADDISAGALGFFYDYYGITEETQQGPPSPVTSPFTSSNEDSKPVSNVSSNCSEKDSSGEDATAAQDSQTKGRQLNDEDSPFSTTSATVSVSASAADEELPPGKEINVKPERTSPTSPDDGSTYGFLAGEKELATFGTDCVQQTLTCSEDERYINILEAQTSIIQKKGEDSLTYLNKGQFYAITCEATKPSSVPSDRVKSFIYLAFRDEKDPRNEMNHWHFWCSQQPNPNQRAFDIDRKACQNVDEFIDEIGYNAFGFTWNPHGKAKVVIRINCLSTDFSPQKGVKGIPLHLQVDTYEDLSKQDEDPVYRAFCQIKVFRDKGAERKNKDESKSAERRLLKFLKNGSNSALHNISSIFQGPNKVTKFNSVSTKGEKPWVFIPKTQTYGKSCSSDESCTGSHTSTATTASPPPLFASIRSQESKRQLAAAVNVAKADLEDLSMLPKQPKCRVMKRKTPAVTIYVRKEEEKVYNALMLENLTLKDLKDAVAHKYGMPAEMVKNLYKKTRKGILVNMDDAMVEQFVDEDDFLIQVNFDNQLGHFELTFHY
ncbi:grainyhead-like protein 2 homolog isoform X2 [Rhopilema esculentum]|uniref:grainyhead-like protein 2 homolog isoform X2 n=1 Tax=Rhopilema esculentum TaxID=499914 RepID=UPI0031E2C843